MVVERVLAAAAQCLAVGRLFIVQQQQLFLTAMSRQASGAACSVSSSLCWKVVEWVELLLTSCVLLLHVLPPSSCPHTRHDSTTRGLLGTTSLATDAHRLATTSHPSTPATTEGALVLLTLALACAEQRMLQVKPSTSSEVLPVCVGLATALSCTALPFPALLTPKQCRYEDANDINDFSNGNLPSRIQFRLVGLPAECNEYCDPCEAACLNPCSQCSQPKTPGAADKKQDQTADKIEVSLPRINT